MIPIWFEIPFRWSSSICAQAIWPNSCFDKCFFFCDKQASASNAMTRRRPPEITVLSATALGGPSDITGNFVIAPLNCVQNRDFWTVHRNIGCIINCTGRHNGQGPWYPREARDQTTVIHIDLHDHKGLEIAFAMAKSMAELTLKDNKDVLVHCQQSYHRCPPVCAGLYQSICGVHYQVWKAFYRLTQGLQNMFENAFRRQWKGL